MYVISVRLLSLCVIKRYFYQNNQIICLSECFVECRNERKISKLC